MSNQTMDLLTRKTNDVKKEVVENYAQYKLERHRQDSNVVIKIISDAQTKHYEHEENTFNMAYKDASSDERIQGYRENQRIKLKKTAIITGGGVAIFVMPTLIKQSGKNSRCRRRTKAIRKIFKR